MRYHNITKNDMKNGPGLRVVLWVAGCDHHCKGCHNPITWDPDGGLPFTYAEQEEIIAAMDHDYIEGFTFSGGDPLHYCNRREVADLAALLKRKFPDKNIWLYTGYTWEEIKFEEMATAIYGSLSRILNNVDVIVDGKFEEDKKDQNYQWAGSTNQRVIDVEESYKKGEPVLYGNASN